MFGSNVVQDIKVLEKWSEVLPFFCPPGYVTCVGFLKPGEPHSLKEPLSVYSSNRETPGKASLCGTVLM